MSASDYPQRALDRDRWVLERRGERRPVDLWRPQGFFTEEEAAETGNVRSVVVILLTSRECPWRCVMCDLWQHTTVANVPRGAIPAQIDFALSRLGPGAADGRHLKLYNSGSFFDARAVPPADHAAIAERVARFDRVIVECHPALVGRAAAQFRDRLRPRLEVAVGLETVNPRVLGLLNKRMTLDEFGRAAGFLSAQDIALRVFLLVAPPFLAESDGQRWTEHSIDFAFGCGATAVSLNLTRPGNGALEALADAGQFATPRLAALERALAYGLSRKHGRVFADLWSLDQFADCAACFPARRERLRLMNVRQAPLPGVACAVCGGMPPGEA